MSHIYSDFLELLHEFEALPDTSKDKNLFDIAGYPHYENVSSNILAFYLNPNNEHGLDELLLSSLMNLAGGNEIHQGNVQVSREIYTKKGGRLDILIETDNQVIGIENKIFHCLNNDLFDYSATLKELAKPKQLEVIKIIISLRNEQESAGFICVTYDELFSTIRERLGSYTSTSSQKWLLFLVDFMNSIENLRGANMEIDENDSFFIKNEDRLQVLLNHRNKFMSRLNREIIRLLNMIEKPKECSKQWVYAKSYLVHDFKPSGYLIAFNLSISPQGWTLELFGRNLKSKVYLNELFQVSPLREQQVALIKNRYLVQKFDLATDLEIIKEKLLEWIDLLCRSERNKNAN